MSIIHCFFLILAILIIILVLLQSDKESSSSSIITGSGNKMNDFVKKKERGSRKIISILTLFIIFSFILTAMLVMIKN